jgi:hypothetical protein
MSRVNSVALRVAASLPFVWGAYTLVGGPLLVEIRSVPMALAAGVPALGLCVAAILVLSASTIRWPWWFVAACSAWLAMTQGSMITDESMALRYENMPLGIWAAWLMTPWPFIGAYGLLMSLAGLTRGRTRRSPHGDARPPDQRRVGP